MIYASVLYVLCAFLHDIRNLWDPGTDYLSGGPPPRGMSELIGAPFTGLAIRDYLITQGEGSPTDVYRELRKVKRRASYPSVLRYFWFCSKMGLIQFVRREPGRARVQRKIYRVVPGMEGDPRWFAPQAAYYPVTRWGGARYGKALERGLIPKRAPPPRYRPPGLLPGMPRKGIPKPTGLPPPFPHGSRRGRQNHKV